MRWFAGREPTYPSAAWQLPSRRCTCERDYCAVLCGVWVGLARQSGGNVRRRGVWRFASASRAIIIGYSTSSIAVLDGPALGLRRISTTWSRSGGCTRTHRPSAPNSGFPSNLALAKISGAHPLEKSADRRGRDCLGRTSGAHPDGRRSADCYRNMQAVPQPPPGAAVRTATTVGIARIARVIATPTRRRVESFRMC